ncbi:MAG: hypothetical protein J1F16_10330 [Muribaculaceae bacterium]|nr:hypothetical protein [Muribaculaceae bacterium]
MEQSDYIMRQFSQLSEFLLEILCKITSREYTHGVETTKEEVFSGLKQYGVDFSEIIELDDISIIKYLEKYIGIIEIDMLLTVIERLAQSEESDMKIKYYRICNILLNHIERFSIISFNNGVRNNRIKLANT